MKGQERASSHLWIHHTLNQELCKCQTDNEVVAREAVLVSIVRIKRCL